MKKKLDANDPLLKKVFQEEIEPHYLICNKCGNAAEPYNEDNYWSQNLMHYFETIFGYGSHYDMDKWSFHLCESCLLHFIKTFKIMPDGFAEDYQNQTDAKKQFRRFKHRKERNSMFNDLKKYKGE